MCFAPVLTMAEAAEHPHNVARGTFVERRRRHAAGAGAALLAAPRRRSPRPPAHAGPAHRRGARRLGLRRRRRSTSSSRPARSSAAQPERWRRSSASTPTPTTRRSPPAARWPSAAAEGHRVVLVVATNGEHGEVARRPRPTARRSSTGARAETERVGRGARRRTGSSGSATRDSRDDGLGAERRPGVVPGRPTSTRRPSGWPRSSREEHADVLTIYDWHGNYGHPDHIQVHRVGHRAAELAGTPSGVRGDHEPRPRSCA